MKSKHLEKLKDLDFKHQRSKYPNVPLSCVALTKYIDTTANGLERCICDFIRYNGYQAERIKNTGRPIDNTQQVTDVLGRTQTIGSISYIKGTGTNGTADISATIFGRSVKIEVKIGKDYQSQAQKEYQQSIESSGGQYWVVKDFDSFYFYYESFLDYIINTAKK